MFNSCQNKEDKVKAYFRSCHNEEQKYEKIIELGRLSPKIEPRYKTPENLVKGCQSQMYLHSYLSGNIIIFEAESDALISAGLAALLTQVYSGETPEVVLKYPPKYLEDLGIAASLTPNRANGLYSMHLRMKQDALKLLVQSGNTL